MIFHHHDVFPSGHHPTIVPLYHPSRTETAVQPWTSPIHTNGEGLGRHSGVRWAGCCVTSLQIGTMPQPQEHASIVPPQRARALNPSTTKAIHNQSLPAQGTHPLPCACGCLADCLAHKHISCNKITSDWHTDRCTGGCISLTHPFRHNEPTLPFPIPKDLPPQLSPP